MEKYGFMYITKLLQNYYKNITITIDFLNKI